MNPDTTGRIGAIDFTKGALVAFMVVYHALNYSAWRAAPGQYMAFLPPSFILITGFLVTHVYTGKYRTDSRRLTRRLLVRGYKLILIFTVLNVLGNAVFARNYNGAQLGLASFWRELGSTYIFGGTGTASFEILLPIGYLLLAAPLFVRGQSVSAHFCSGLAAMLFVGCVWMEQAGIAWSIAGLLTVGIIGMAAGRVPLTKWDAVARHWPYVAGAYAVYWICRQSMGQIYLMQVFAACASVILLYTAGLRSNSSNLIIQEFSRLGRYSLISYIAQIAVLQVLHRVSWFDGTKPVGVIGMGALTLVLTWGTVCAADWSRSRSDFLDQSYRAVFG